MIKNIGKFDDEYIEANQGFFHDTQLAKILNVEIRHLDLKLCQENYNNKGVIFPNGVTEKIASKFVDNMQNMIDCALQSKIDEENSSEYKFVQNFNNDK